MVEAAPAGPDEGEVGGVQAVGAESEEVPQKDWQQQQSQHGRQEVLSRMRGVTPALLLDGRPATPGAVRRAVAYVAQDDVLQPQLTVRVMCAVTIINT